MERARYVETRVKVIRAPVCIFRKVHLFDGLQHLNRSSLAAIFLVDPTDLDDEVFNELRVFYEIGFVNHVY